MHHSPAASPSCLLSGYRWQTTRSCDTPVTLVPRERDPRGTRSAGTVRRAQGQECAPSCWLLDGCGSTHASSLGSLRKDRHHLPQSASRPHMNTRVSVDSLMTKGSVKSSHFTTLSNLILILRRHHNKVTITGSQTRTGGAH